jgi:hypothetical protein
MKAATNPAEDVEASFPTALGLLTFSRYFKAILGFKNPFRSPFSRCHRTDDDDCPPVENNYNRFCGNELWPNAKPFSAM